MCENNILQKCTPAADCRSSIIGITKQEKLVWVPSSLGINYLDCPVEMLHSSRCPVLRDFDLSLHTGSACFEVRLAGGDMWLSLKLASLPSSFWKEKKHQIILNWLICRYPYRKRVNIRLVKGKSLSNS